MESGIERAISESKISRLILGEGDFFIPNPTYRDKHDQTLVFRELFNWAVNTNNEQLLYSIVGETVNTLIQYAKYIPVLRLFHSILIVMRSESEHKKKLGNQYYAMWMQHAVTLKEESLKSQDDTFQRYFKKLDTEWSAMTES
jgi:hypothetical protein